MKLNPNAKCPHCGKPNTGATGLESLENIPAPGNFSICLYCAELGIFCDDLSIRRVTREDIAQLPPEDAIELGIMHGRARLAIKILHENRAEGN
jgi:hypothetical protein